MSLTEKERLYKWASEHSSETHREKMLSSKDDETQSYYVKRDNSHCVEIYDWESIAGLKERLDALWGDDSQFVDVEKVVLAASFKEHEVRKQHNKQRRETEYKALPEFVYVF
jgi:hypothetical protein